VSVRSVKPQKPEYMLLRLMRVADILTKGEIAGEDAAFPLIGIETPDDYVDTFSPGL
jgi:hypothetical protein